MHAERRIPIRTDEDIVRARQEGSALAAQAGFSPTDLTVLASAISELARNIFSYAGQGEVELHLLERDGRRGIRVVARDAGPGIHDPERALEDGFSTAGRLGLGLAGVRRLVDQFELKSTVGVGTEITMHKWAR
jgi:serine/threonine-protein kinase RsbT